MSGRRLSAPGVAGTRAARAYVAVAALHAFVLCALACDDAAVFQCGGGGALSTIDGVRYCVYSIDGAAARDVVCPAGASRRIELEGSIVCTSLPPDVEVARETCASLGISCDGQPDASIDAGPSDAGGSPDVDADVGCAPEPVTPCTDESCNVALVTSGYGFSCALTVGGDVWCWGDNEHGQLGDGTSCERSAPVRARISDESRLTAGDHHVCARTVSGQVFCWGSNSHGQLALPLAELYRDEPVETPGLPITAGAEDLLAGGDHTCAVVRADAMAVGELHCWGRNDYGQSGRPVSLSAPPARVEGLPDVGDLGIGHDHSCALSSDGLELWCFGRGTFGELGDGEVHSAPEGVPTPVSSPGPFRDVTAGADHTCVRRTTPGAIECFGSAALGETGAGQDTLAPVLTPTVVDLADGAEGYNISSRGHSTCALYGPTAGFRIFCWGDNQAGQLLVPATTVVRSPAQVTSAALAVGVHGVAVGWQHTCAWVGTQDVYCWGVNSLGEVQPGAPSLLVSTPSLVRLPFRP